MNLKSMDLVWIVVNDVKKAIAFYTETVGLQLKEFNEEHGWAELEGAHGGARLGIAQNCSKTNDQVQPGQNAVMTFTVKNLQEAAADMLKKGAKFLGDIEEVPGHVKMQTVQDVDGNRFQLVEVLHKKHSCCSC